MVEIHPLNRGFNIFNPPKGGLNSIQNKGQSKVPGSHKWFSCWGYPPVNKHSNGKMDPLKMYFLLKMGIFHGYVSLPEGWQTGLKKQILEWDNRELEFLLGLSSHPLYTWILPKWTYLDTSDWYIFETDLIWPFRRCGSHLFLPPPQFWHGIVLGTNAQLGAYHLSSLQPVETHQPRQQKYKTNRVGLFSCLCWPTGKRMLPQQFCWCENVTPSKDFGDLPIEDKKVTDWITWAICIHYRTLHLHVNDAGKKKYIYIIYIYYPK